MRISVNVTAAAASGKSTDRRGRAIATKTKTSNKNQIPIFRIRRLSVDMKNPAFVSASMRFVEENVKYRIRSASIVRLYMASTFCFKGMLNSQTRFGETVLTGCQLAVSDILPRSIV
jgi:hypothetical protein